MSRHLWFSCFLASLPTCGVWAHAGLHEAVDGITRQIARDPANAGLYLQRGELQRQHEDWDAALADYERAAQLDPALWQVDFARGRMFLEAGWLQSARAILSEFVNAHPEHAPAHQMLGQVYARQNDPLRAAAEYALAIRYSPQVTPEIYLAQAQALIAAGPGHWKAAVEALDDGMKKLGGCIPTLQNEAIELEIRRGRYDAALDRLAKLQDQSPRKELWLARRGAILVQAGRSSEARAAYRDALAAIRRVNPARRQTVMLLDLERQIDSALAALDTPSPQTRPVGQEE